MTRSRIPLPALAVGLLLAACQGNTAPGASGAIRYDPPNTSFAARLNIAAPVTEDEAKAIAVEAVGGGTVLGVAKETERGQVLYEVRVRAPSGRLEVEVRESDGAVVEIEPDDGN